jgi:osmotically-inducible protein OsmY
MHEFRIKKGKDTMRKSQNILKFLICIGLIAAFMGCASTQKHESTGQYIDDTVITSKVKAAILDEPSLKVFQINVKTYQGAVQLSGFVDSMQSVTRTGEVAGTVTGVTAVKNDLNLK